MLAATGSSWQQQEQLLFYCLQQQLKQVAAIGYFLYWLLPVPLPVAVVVSKVVIISYGDNVL